MGNKEHSYLTDKLLRELQPKESSYWKIVGEPKELYIRVYPNNKKIFYIKYVEYDAEKSKKLKEFRK